jgi:hypothetical protein
MIAMSVKDFPLPWNMLNMVDDPQVDGHFANLSSPIPGQKKRYIISPQHYQIAEPFLPANADSNGCHLPSLTARPYHF